MKRFSRCLLGCLIVTLCFASAGLAEAIGVNLTLQAGKTAVLIGADGEIKVPAGVYSVITPISPAGTPPEDELFAAFPSALEERSPLGRNCLLLDAEGEAMTEPVYQYLVSDSSRILYMIDSLYGVMDGNQTEILPCAYTNLVGNGEGGYLALTTDPYDDVPDGVYYIDAAGNESPTAVRIVYHLQPMTEGLMPVSSGENGRMGYLDARGEWAISPQFRYAGNFHGRYAKASLDSGVGLIDRDGNWLVTPKYRNISFNLDEGNLILAELNSQIHLIDPVSFEVKKVFEGKELHVSASFDNGLATIYDVDAARLIDSEGTILFTHDRDTVFSSWLEMGDRVIVQKGQSGEDGTYLTNRAGVEIFGPVKSISYLGESEGKRLYQYAAYEVLVESEPSVDWEALIEVEGTRMVGVIDENGQEIMSPMHYTTMDFVTDGVFLVKDDASIGLIDTAGNEILMIPLEK